jgi:hypothetical protein
MAQVIYEFELPDGSILEIEGDEGKQAEATAKAKEYIAAQQPTPLTGKEQAVDIGRSIATGAYKGIAGTAGLPGMLERGIESVVTPTPKPEDVGKKQPITKYFEALRNLRGMISPLPSLTTQPITEKLFGGYMPTYEQITDVVEQIPGAEAVTKYESKTPLGKYAETLSEFITPGAAVARTGKGLAQAAAIGTTAGTTQFGLEQLGAPLAVQVPLTLFTSGITGYLTSPSRAAQIANQALKGVDDAELSAAILLEKQIKDKFGNSVKITAPELIDNKVIQRLAADIYGTEKGGQIMFNYLKDRPKELKNIANRLMDELAEKPEYLDDALQNIGTSAKKALKTAKDERTITSQKSGYTVSNKEFVNESQIIELLDDIDARIAQGGDSGPVYNELIKLKRRLTKAPDTKVDEDILIVDEFGLPSTEVVKKRKRIPQTNVNNLDLVLREFRKKVDDFYLQSALKETTSIDSGTLNVLSNEAKTGVIDMLDDILKTNPNYKAAKNTYARLSEELVVPVKDNLKGLLKGDVDINKVKSFIFNPDKRSAAEIKKTYEILNKTDPDAFPTLARIYIESQANKAFVLKEAGESAKTGFNLYKRLIGDDASKANFNSVLKGVAEARGINPNDLILGWNNFNEVLKRTGRIVNIDSPGTPIDPKFLPRDLAQIGSFMWRVKFAGKLDEKLQQRAIKQLANVFTKDNSVEELVRLGKTGVDTNEAVRRTAYLVSISEPGKQLPEENNITPPQ